MDLDRSRAVGISRNRKAIAAITRQAAKVTFGTFAYPFSFAVSSAISENGKSRQTGTTERANGRHRKSSKGRSLPKVFALQCTFYPLRFAPFGHIVIMAFSDADYIQATPTTAIRNEKDTPCR